ncbi:hypothetical protein EV363DRAFT_1178176, partial [Boletus edulis]
SFTQPGLANSDLLLRMFHLLSVRTACFPQVSQGPHPRGSSGTSPHEAIREAASRIGWNVVFENPTLGHLASHLIRYVVGAEACPIALPDLKANIDTMVAVHSNLGRWWGMWCREGAIVVTSCCRPVQRGSHQDP